MFIGARERADTGESRVWVASRSIAVLIVLGLHLGVIALLVIGTRFSTRAVSASPPLTLLYLPPSKIPKVRADSARPKHLWSNVGISIAPPSLDSSSLSAPASETGGNGPGVNWAAEKRRAVAAFEIRRDQQVTYAMIGSSPWDGWLPQRMRDAIDRSRTESGDWIVWINGNCYQIARWHTSTPAQEAEPPQTICVDDSGERPAGPIDQSTNNPPPKQ